MDEFTCQKKKNRRMKRESPKMKSPWMNSPAKMKSPSQDEVEKN
jgi:hypothetical protein